QAAHRLAGGRGKAAQLVAAVLGDCGKQLPRARPLRQVHAAQRLSALRGQERLAFRLRRYQRDISSIASHDVAAAATSTPCALCQPQCSMMRANAVGEPALTIRTGVAMSPRTAPPVTAPKSTSGTAPRTMVITP